MSRTTPRLLLLLLAATSSAVACSRIEIEQILVSGTLLDDPARTALVLHLRPEYLAAPPADALPESLVDAARLVWQASSVISIQLDAETEVLLPDLTASFALHELELVALDESLTFAARYQAPPLRASLRFKQSGGDTFCRVDLELGMRELVFALVPAVREGIPQWQAQLQSGLDSETPLTWSAVETCAFDLEALDWSRIDARIDTDLSAQSSTAFMPILRDLVVAELALPRAGLRLLPRESGFYAPNTLTLAARAASTPPWTGAALDLAPEEGLRAAFDLQVDTTNAACAKGLGELPPLTPTPLTTHTAPERTPAGDRAWQAALVLDQGFATNLVHALLRSGLFCTDLLATPRGTTLPALDTFVPGLAQLPGLALSRRGRVRLQPTAPAVRVDVAGPDALRVHFDGLRVEVYAETDDALLVRVALLEGRFVMDLHPVISASGTLSLELSALSTTIAASDGPLLEVVDRAELASRVFTELLARTVALPLPQPFGRAPTAIELESRDGALWAYFSW